MKKGPWTSAEDAMLIEYVNKHGEGNWNKVHKNSGLARCGKSCRLRWTNHLRPNLKKGSFSVHEQNAIIYLHSKLGNKWARIASLMESNVEFQLPGRTDNETKNFWNTRMKRCLKAGMPLYPPSPSQPNNASPTASHSISPTLPSSSPSSPPHLDINALFSYFSAKNNPLHNTANPFHQLSFPHHNSSNIGANLGLPLLSLVSPYASSSALPSHTFVAHPPVQPLLPSVNACNAQISSTQTPPPNNGYSQVPPVSPQPNNGLLEDLVVEAHALSRNEDSTTLIDLSNKSESTASESQRTDQFTGNKPSGEDPLGKDDDLFGLLNSFSCEMPMPDWYRGGNQSLALESQSHISPGPTAQEFPWALGNCWNNLPGIS